MIRSKVANLKEDVFNGADGGFGLDLGRGGDDFGEGFEDRGAGGDDECTRGGGIPVLFILESHQLC